MAEAHVGYPGIPSKLPEFDVHFDKHGKKLIVHILNLTQEQAAKADGVMKELFPNHEAHSQKSEKPKKSDASKETYGFWARFDNGAEATKFVNALETKDVGKDKKAEFIRFLQKTTTDRRDPDIAALQTEFEKEYKAAPYLISDINFPKPNTIRDHIQHAEDQRFAATCPVFEVKGKKTGIYVTLKRVPQDIVATLMPILANNPHMGEIEIKHNGSVTIGFDSGKDAKGLYKSLRNTMTFSEGEHVIMFNIDKAAKHYQDVNKQK